MTFCVAEQCRLILYKYYCTLGGQNMWDELLTIGKAYFSIFLLALLIIGIIKLLDKIGERKDDDLWSIHRDNDSGQIN